MASPYKRRRPALLLNLWLYRYLVASSVVLGVILWFILINNTPVAVTFPFGLGRLESRTGLLILLSALAGSVATALLMTVALAWRRLRRPGDRRPSDDDPPTLPDDRPPTDYAAKTTEGFSWPSP